LGFVALTQFYKIKFKKMPKQVIEQEKNWYVIHTYSGYEDAVAKNLKQRIESLGMEDKIFNVIVPKEKKIKIKNGKRKTVEEKIYPGYVLVQMMVTDASWYVVRNTPRVTGFLGAGTTPIPVSASDMADLMKRMEMSEPEFTIDFEIGDTVKVNDGPFKGFEGKVSEIDKERGKIKVLVNMFGRDTPVELDSLQIKKLS
jgi:transcription termination/antitermination protein NusG